METREHRRKFDGARYSRRKDVGVFDSELWEATRKMMELPPKRGTPEWDLRERARQALGCQCLSFGPIRSGSC